MPGRCPTNRASLLPAGIMQKSWNGIHTVSHTFPPLEDPIDRHRHVAGQRHFNARMCVDEVNRAGAGGGDDAKVVAFRKQGIERTERMCAPSSPLEISALALNRGFSGTSGNRYPVSEAGSPRPDTCRIRNFRTATALRNRNPIRVSFARRDGRDARRRCVAVRRPYHGLNSASLSIEAEVIGVQRHVLCQRSDAVGAPESN